MICSVATFAAIQEGYFIRTGKGIKQKNSPAVETVVKDTKKNPKRAQRDAKKQTLETGVGTKSQQALKLQQEQNKQERKVRSREQRDAENQRLFELRQLKKREKHKGH